MNGKYEPLAWYLQAIPSETLNLTITFQHIEEILRNLYQLQHHNIRPGGLMRFILISHKN